jgi:hypothetical protein
MDDTLRRGLVAQTAVLNRLVQLGFEVLFPYDNSLALSLHFLVEAPQAANNSYNESGWMPDWNCA